MSNLSIIVVEGEIGCDNEWALCKASEWSLIISPNTKYVYFLRAIRVVRNQIQINISFSYLYGNQYYNCVLEYLPILSIINL